MTDGAEKVLSIAGSITVGELADALNLPVTTLIGELFKNGIAATINQRIDFETGILRDRELAGGAGVVARLEPRVLGERRPGFLRLRTWGMVGERHERDRHRAEDAADLVELAGVRGGDQQTGRQGDGHERKSATSSRCSVTR